MISDSSTGAIAAEGETPIIQRAAGKTKSERYLASLAERSFLDLWSYPNVFVDRRSNGGRSDGKELCDLLVVCGDHVLIFSDKSIAWPAVDDPELAWSRWFRRAVKKSADQVRGAERWITNHPDRLFLDSACSKPFPLELPPADRRRVHGIVVALGAADAARKHFGYGSGSLQIDPSIKGVAHADHDSGQSRILTIGDVDPGGSFVHVFDDVTLDVVMQELDTITDFAEYLDRKAEFIRAGHLRHAGGEEDLLALYLTRTNSDREHAFVKEDGSSFGDGEFIRIERGAYASMRQNPAYIAKKRADEISYVWDNLIRAFTKNIIGGTLVSAPDWLNEIQDDRHELGVRHMALEDRTQRRAYGEGIIDALKRGTSSRFARGFIPSPIRKNSGTAYVFMLLRRPDGLAGGYQQYRELRSSMLYGYAINTLRQQPHLQRVIAIGTEPMASPNEQAGSSEDLLYMEMPEWTEEEIAEAERFRNHYSIFSDDTLNQYNIHTEEYPQVPPGIELSYTNPIAYDFLHPAPTELGAAAQETRRKGRATFKARLLGSTL